MPRAALSAEMYETLFRSFVRWFLDRGNSLGIANLSAQCALSIAAFFNAYAVAALIDLAGGPHTLSWLATHQWAFWCSLGGLFAFHWAYGRRPGLLDGVADAHLSFAWLGYAVPTLCLALFTVGWLLSRM
jgi:hypothetical protein